MRKLLPRAAVVLVGLVATWLAAGLATFASASRSRDHRASAAALDGSFSLLRGPLTRGTPPNLARAVGRAPGNLGLDIAGARYAAATGAWLIPGSDGMCIATQDEDGLGMACGSTASAEEGKLAFVERSVPSEEESIVGAAPDGRDEAVGIAAGGDEVSCAAVRENSYRLIGGRIDTATLRTGLEASVTCGR
jgi:hypothetical protein